MAISSSSTPAHKMSATSIDSHGSSLPQLYRDRGTAWCYSLRDGQLLQRRGPTCAVGAMQCICHLVGARVGGGCDARDTTRLLGILEYAVLVNQQHVARHLSTFLDLTNVFREASLWQGAQINDPPFPTLKEYVHILATEHGIGEWVRANAVLKNFCENGRLHLFDIKGNNLLTMEPKRLPEISVEIDNR